MVMLTIHTNPKTLFKPKKFEDAGFSFSCGRKHFENGAFLKTMTSDDHVISLTAFYSTQIQTER